MDLYKLFLNRFIYIIFELLYHCKTVSSGEIEAFSGMCNLDQICKIKIPFTTNVNIENISDWESWCSLDGKEIVNSSTRPTALGFAVSHDISSNVLLTIDDVSSIQSPSTELICGLRNFSNGNTAFDRKRILFTIHYLENPEISCSQNMCKCKANTSSSIVYTWRNNNNDVNVSKYDIYYNDKGSVLEINNNINKNETVTCSADNGHQMKSSTVSLQFEDKVNLMEDIPSSENSTEQQNTGLIVLCVFLGVFCVILVLGIIDLFRRKVLQVQACIERYITLINSVFISNKIRSSAPIEKCHILDDDKVFKVTYNDAVTFVTGKITSENGIEFNGLPELVLNYLDQFLMTSVTLPGIKDDYILVSLWKLDKPMMNIRKADGSWEISKNPFTELMAPIESIQFDFWSGTKFPSGQLVFGGWYKKDHKCIPFMVWSDDQCKWNVMPIPINIDEDNMELKFTEFREGVYVNIRSKETPKLLFQGVCGADYQSFEEKETPGNREDVQFTFAAVHNGQTSASVLDETEGSAAAETNGLRQVCHYNIKTECVESQIYQDVSNNEINIQKYPENSFLCHIVQDRRGENGLHFKVINHLGELLSEITAGNELECPVQCKEIVPLRGGKSVLCRYVENNDTSCCKEIVISFANDIKLIV